MGVRTSPVPRPTLLNSLSLPTIAVSVLVREPPTLVLCLVTLYSTTRPPSAITDITMAKKTDLQERVKRDCGDPSRVCLFLMSASTTRVLISESLHSLWSGASNGAMKTMLPARASLWPREAAHPRSRPHRRHPRANMMRLRYPPTEALSSSLTTSMKLLQSMRAHRLVRELRTRSRLCATRCRRHSDRHSCLHLRSPPRRVAKPLIETTPPTMLSQCSLHIANNGTQLPRDTTSQRRRALASVRTFPRHLDIHIA